MSDQPPPPPPQGPGSPASLPPAEGGGGWTPPGQPAEPPRPGQPPPPPPPPAALPLPPPPPPPAPGYAPAMPPPPPPAGYGPMAPAVPSDTQAVVSLVLGICSIFCCFLGPVAFFIGNSAIKRIRSSGGTIGGEGMAQAGRILGVIGTVFLALGVLWVVVVVIVNVGQARTGP